ncbi:MAG: J domain-containing protein [Chloroflexota bacterium]|nr:J domain-containing protein [Chloroflexota bacterium]
MPEENIYDLLQVESTVDSRAIRAAYPRVMLLHHPDLNPGPDVQEMTQRLNDAYEVLCNLDRRVAYDNGLFGWVEELAPEPGPEGTRPTPGNVAF